MKKNIFIAAAAALLALAACKTNEANYRAAYELAQQKRTATGDSTSTQGLIDQQTPKTMVIAGVELPVRTERVRTVKDEADQTPSLKKYCVVVAQFRQIFNANSMRSRLAEQGYTDAFVAVNGMQDHYVVAAATDIPAEAAATLQKLKSDSTLILKSPYPYILRPAQLVR